jgi:uncharacterized protein YbjQ (UPF0145 family)
MERGRRALEDLVDEVNRVFGGPVEAYREALREAGYTPLPAHEPIRLDGS